MPKSSHASAEEIWGAIQSIQSGENVTTVAAKIGRNKTTVKTWLQKHECVESLEALQLAINPNENRYRQIMRSLFTRYKEGSPGFDWERKELKAIASSLNIVEPDNLGDNIYSIRHGREDLPAEIRELAPQGKDWLLLPNGKSAYRFALTDRAFLEPDTSRRAIKIPDSTPQIIARYAQQDEQAVLARIRYCRLVDIFMGMASYQLQSHMRTTMAHFKGAQTELDEIYVGVNTNGTQFVIPIQAKAQNEKIGVIQIITDHFTCQEKFPTMATRTLAAKIVRTERLDGFGEILTVALIEGLVEGKDWDYNVTKIAEEHFQLVPSSSISDDELKSYRSRFTR
jgi:hypothetical protein